MEEKKGFSDKDLREIESSSISILRPAEPGLPSTWDVEAAPAAIAPSSMYSLTPEGQGAGFSSRDLAEVRKRSLSTETEITPSFEEVAREVGIGGFQGAKSTVVGGGALLGGRAGATIGGAVAGPPGAVVGGTLGFFTGLTLGALTDQALDNLFPLPRREDLVPYREGSKVTASVISNAPWVFGIPKSDANRVAKFLSGLGETARTYPRAFMTSEAIGGVGAGSGAALAEAYAPGDATTRFFAEAVGGLSTGPTRFITSQVGAAKSFLGSFMQSFSPDAREAKAANILYSGLVEAGEDPKKIVAFLNSKEAQDAIRLANPTVAQLTGVPLFSRLEATLAKKSSDYREAIKEQGNDAFTVYQHLAHALRNIGDPNALKAAADLESVNFLRAVDKRMEIAGKNAAEKIDKIKVDSPVTRRQVGEITKTEVLSALDEARELERDLWKKAVAEGYRRTRAGEIVPKAVTPSGMMKEFLYVLDGMTPERYSKEYMDTLGPIMQRLGYKDEFYNRFVQGKRTEQFLQSERVPDEFLKNVRGKSTNIEDLAQIRSDLLSYARRAAKNNDIDEARIYGRLAEAVLDDISKEGHFAYDTARKFSRDLNEYFTRGYAGELRAVGPRGSEKLPAEVLVSKVYGSNADLTFLRINQIEDSAKFARSQYEKIKADTSIPSARKAELLSQLEPYALLSDERVNSIVEAQRNAVLSIVNNLTDSFRGEKRISPDKLAKYVNDNRQLLDKLGLTADLKDVESAENLVRQVADVNSKITSKLIKQTAFSNVLASKEKPSEAIVTAINSNSPFSSFNKLVNLAKRGGQDSIDGLKSSVYDYAFTKAGGLNNSFSVQAFEDALFKSVNPDQPNATLVNILRSQGVLSRSEVDNLKKLIEPMKRVEAALVRGQPIDELVAGADAVTELALRIIGSRIGTAAAPGGPGSLIAAAAGSKAVRTLFDKMPTMSITKIIEDATKDPQLMAMLLQKGRTVDQRIQLGRQLHGYLWASGYHYLNYEPPKAEEVEVPATPTTGPSAAQMLRQATPRQAPPAPPTQGVPGFKLPMQQGPGPGMGPRSEAAPTQSRQMLASLFPFDTISGLGARPSA